MRFILTQTGEKLLKIMEVENESDNQVKTEINQSNINNNISKTSNSSKFSKSKSPHQRQIFKDRAISQTKIIEIQQKKLNIPKIINEKYNNNPTQGPSLILPELPKNLASRNRTLSSNYESTSNMTSNQSNYNSDRSTFKLNYPIRDVIKDETYVKLQKNLKAMKISKDRVSCVNETNFRSIYKAKSEIEDVDDILNNTKLDNNKINLIKYLNSKDNISHKFLKNLSEANDDKINKINKFCQIIANEGEANDIYKSIVKEKIKNNFVKDKNECNILFTGMYSDVDISKKICADHNNYVPTRQEKFYEIHKDYQKIFWKKYNVDVLQRKNNVNHIANASNDNLNDSYKKVKN